MDNSLQKIKQPAPSVTTVNSSQNGKQYKVIKNPYVGEIKVPKSTNTPLLDWVELKKQENPQTKYKVTTNKNILPKFDTAAGIGVLICGIASLVKLIKK